MEGDHVADSIYFVAVSRISNRHRGYDCSGIRHLLVDEEKGQCGNAKSYNTDGISKNRAYVARCKSDIFYLYGCGVCSVHDSNDFTFFIRG